MRPRSLLVVLTVTLALAACGSGGAAPGAAACASSLTYHGQDYVGHSAEVAPSDLGGELGKASTPGCNDAGGTSARDEEVVAVEVKGVSPSVAVAVTSSDGVLFLREDQHVGSAPQQVLRLLRAVDVASPVPSPVSE